MLPIDVHQEVLRTFATMLYPDVKLLGQMDEAANGMSLVILDTCRNNQFNRNFCNTDQGLAQEIASTDSFISYATASDEVDADQDGQMVLLLGSVRVHQNLFAR